MTSVTYHPAPSPSFFSTITASSKDEDKVEKAFFNLMTNPFSEDFLHQCCNYARQKNHPLLADCVEMKKDDVLKEINGRQQHLIFFLHENEKINDALIHFKILLKIDEEARRILEKNSQGKKVSLEEVQSSSEQRKKAAQLAAQQIAHLNLRSYRYPEEMIN